MIRIPNASLCEKSQILFIINNDCQLQFNFIELVYFYKISIVSLRNNINQLLLIASKNIYLYHTLFIFNSVGLRHSDYSINAWFVSFDNLVIAGCDHQFCQRLISVSASLISLLLNFLWHNMSNNHRHYLRKCLSCV